MKDALVVVVERQKRAVGMGISVLVQIAGVCRKTNGCIAWMVTQKLLCGNCTLLRLRKKKRK